MKKVISLVLGCLLFGSSMVLAFSWNPIKDGEDFGKESQNAEWKSAGTGELYLTAHLNEADGFSFVAMLVVAEIKHGSIEGQELPATSVGNRYKLSPLLRDSSFTSRRMRGYTAVERFTFELKEAEYSTASDILSFGFDKTAKLTTYCQIFLEKNGKITHRTTQLIPVSDVKAKNRFFLVDPKDKVTEFFGHY